MDNRCIKDNTVLLKKQGEKSKEAGRKQKSMNKDMGDHYSGSDVVLD